MDRTSYVKIIIAIVIILLGVYLVYPVIPGLIGGLVLAYTFLPVYNKIYEKTKSNNLSAAFTTLFVSAPILVTLLYAFFKALEELDLLIEIFRTHSYLTILKLFGLYMPESPLHKLILEFFPQIIDITVLFSKTMGQLHMTLLNLVILMLSLYYFLSERASIENFVRKALPPSYYKDIHEILQPINGVMEELMYGNIMSALITGLLSIIGFYVLGVQYSFLLGLLVGLASFLPIVGSWTIFIPLGIYHLFLGNYIKGVLLLIYGAVILEILYNYCIYPKFCKHENQLHPFIVLVGVLGGLYMLGPIGLLYGPIIIGLLKAVAEALIKENVYKRRFFRL
ncbi:MAG: putative inner membrane protein [Candidatus Methanofastidiosum methylothiophilum]|jgi:predicted PurR-regulated permease PerM|uniref:Putative inner membrane protein n=1 Tax=Candidatus Methanofastidiosum methylothiophilum TaxID=1705564 RepID=A0A150JID3_9EURY|nr:MAG: putative inner membrane protein [Candidatus Methanofastidiosum methylthiophilus]MBP6932567.1 AI-2E family transporter [Methanofastidiosum sp.]OQC52174.1 MAG: putative inner membrane protein [Euryarchaeota archaeon ADurb.Bin023]KYC56858.1 MAG: putative inner membrane protein [Candidatus Methanofastidiosum methylthiophilus]KYC58640.1 MAG: putative inner membrane protein [Candidatus Methanofastidiosum methylthiophilus]